MKKSTFWMLLTGSAALAAVVTLAACADDNDDNDDNDDDNGRPCLEVSPARLSFRGDGTPEGAATILVRSNRPWVLTVVGGGDWVTPSVTSGRNDGQVGISVSAGSVGRKATLRFSLRNACGACLTREVTVEQGEQPRAGEVLAADAGARSVVTVRGDQEGTVSLIHCGTEGGGDSTYVSMAQFIPETSGTSDRFYPSCSTVDGEPATGFKLGTSTLSGLFTSEALGDGAAGARKLSFYAVAWIGCPATLHVRVENGGSVVGEASRTLAGNAGAAGAGNDFALTGITERDYFTFELTGLTPASTITFSTSPDFTSATDRTSGRAVVLGVRLY